MTTDQKPEATHREIVILRAVFVTAFGAVILWAGGRLMSTVGLETVTASNKEMYDQLAQRRSTKLALMNQRIAAIESFLRMGACPKVEK